MKTSALCVFILLSIASLSLQGQVVGSYRSEELGYFERGMLYLSGVTSFITGNELTLNHDSTFNMKTCSIMATGEWYCDNDSLFLVTKTRIWRNDSIQKVGFNGEWPEIPTSPVVYYISKNGLYREIWLRSGGDDRRKSADRLIKISGHGQATHLFPEHAR